MQERFINFCTAKCVCIVDSLYVRPELHTHTQWNIVHRNEVARPANCSAIQYA